LIKERSVDEKAARYLERGGQMKRNYIILFVLGALLAVGATLAVNPPQKTIGEVTELWSLSGHADYASVSFTNWDEDGQIPPTCAKCHSTTGFHNFLGIDGSTVGEVDNPIPIGTTVMCSACHNPEVHAMTTVPYPGGFEVQPRRNEASCLNCHQGRATGLRIEQAIDGLELDESNEELSFVSVHYGIAALAKMGSETHGAYQYEGQTYQGYYVHVREFETCETCHDPHDANIRVENCTPCHFNVATYGDIRLIREDDTDWAGDGIIGGVDADIQVMHNQLLQLIYEYASEVVEEPILYNFDQFPYWFQGTQDDQGPPYEAWTPRLLRTAYNYHFIMNAKGAFAHNPRYALQVLYDSIGDLAEMVDADTDGMVRAPNIVQSGWQR
jgi:hypothetical protein